MLDGGLVVRGDLSAAGHLLSHPSGPSLVSGITTNGCGPLFFNGGTPAGIPNGIALFPQRTSSPAPIMLAQVDESGDDNGATSVRVVRPASNRTTFRCNSIADAIHWLAIDPSPAGGSWSFPGGLQVEAGVQSLGASATGSVTFPTPFSQEPVVLLTLEEPGTAGNLVDFARVVQNTTASGFSYSMEAAPAAGLMLHWVALGTSAGNNAAPPWTFRHGRYQWSAGYIQSGSCVTPCAYNFPAPLLTAPHVFLSIHDTDNTAVPNWVRILGVTPSQLVYRLSGVTERVNYLILEDVP